MTTGGLGQISSKNIFRIIYCSTMTIEGGPAVIGQKVTDLVSWSRMWNRNSGISGALLVDSESFSQVLEGPARAVKELFGHIYFDTRNRDVTLLEAGFVEKREFPTWSMAYVGSLGTAETQVTPSQMLFDNHTPSERVNATLKLLLYVLKANHETVSPQAEGGLTR